MKPLFTGWCLLLLMFFSIELSAQQRQDVIWARNTTEDIVLDGILDEASWAQAESLQIVYGQSAGLPHSGWQTDPGGGPGAVTDPTEAVVKFLAKGNLLYLAFDVKDKTVGGLNAWANWDGILMSVKRRNTESFLDGGVSSATELFYSFWYADTAFGVGTPPVFRGFYDNATVDTVPANPAAWDAYWRTDGVTNDSIPDNGWRVEMKINLDSLGIDATGPEGNVVELNFSIWDKDVTAGDPLASYLSRTWWQNPWNNDDNPGRVHIRPDVTVSSGPVPEVEPDLVFKNGAGVDDPVIDGVLDEPVWAMTDLFDLAWDNIELRKTYKGIGPYRSGRFQPEITINNTTTKAAIQDPVVAHIKGFFKDNFLYLAGDVEDKIVQGVGESETNIMDGLVFRLGDRDSLTSEHRLIYRELGMYFNTEGNPAALRDLPIMVEESETEYAVALKGNTIVNDQSAIDEGYTFELKVDLSFLGYPYEDNAVFFGTLLRDGDSFDDDPLQNYGSRTWFFGEFGNWSIAWAYMDPDDLITSVDDKEVVIPKSIELYGNYPNPFNPETKIKFSIPQAGDVRLTVFNILGQEVSSVLYKDLTAGSHEQLFNAEKLSSGIYLYKLEFKAADSERIFTSKIGKMTLLK